MRTRTHNLAIRSLFEEVSSTGYAHFVQAVRATRILAFRPCTASPRRSFISLLSTSNADNVQGWEGQQSLVIAAKRPGSRLHPPRSVVDMQYASPYI